VLVVATSNLTGAIDAAFIDRADIKQYVGPPGVSARYEILASCVAELRRAKVIDAFDPLLAFRELQPLLPQPPADFALLSSLPPSDSASQAPRHSMMLHALAAQCEGLSGRALRKLPFLAHALFLHTEAPTLDHFLGALCQAIQHEQLSRAQLGHGVQPT